MGRLGFGGLRFGLDQMNPAHVKFLVNALAIEVCSVQYVCRPLRH